MRIARILLDTIRCRHSSQLNLPCPHNPLPNLRGPFRLRSRPHLFVVHGRHINMNVNPVHQRPGNLLHVALNHRLGAAAFAGTIIEESARAWIHRCRQHESRRKCQRHGRACNAYSAVLQRLTHHFQHIAWKFRQLVQKQYAVVRERNLARSRDHSTTNQASIGNRMVWRSERPHPDQAGSRIKYTRHTVDFCSLEGFFECERRQNGRHSFGQHGLAGSGRPNHQNVVPSGAGYLERSLCGLLPADIFKIA